MFFHGRPWFKYTRLNYYFNGQVETKEKSADQEDGLFLTIGINTSFHSIKVPIGTIDKLVDWIVQAYPGRYQITRREASQNVESRILRIVQMAPALPIQQSPGDPGTGPANPPGQLE